MIGIQKSPYPLALEYLYKIARGVIPGADAFFLPPETMVITSQKGKFLIPLSRSSMQDLEQALASNQSVKYSKGLKSDARFALYQFLSREGGLPPDFRLSDFFLVDAERDWQSNVSLQTHFDSKMAKGLYENLKRLERSLERTFNSDISLPEIDQELAVIRELTGWYEANQNLNSFNVLSDKLSYLKAAAVCWILDLERRRDAEVAPRAKAAYVTKIFEVAAPFQMQPCNRIKLPAAMEDYVAREKSAVDTSQRGLRQHADVEALLEALEPRLRDRWVGAWQALESDNADGVSQAANSMVEVLDKVIGKVVGEQTFEEYLNSRFPTQADMLKTQRQWIGKVKDGLHTVKHHTEAQSVQTGEDMMQAAELIIRMLLRK